jgi:hypothetical protein
MRACPSDDCPHYQRSGNRAEYHDDVDRCADCGAGLVDADSVRPGPDAELRRKTELRTWKMTIIAILVIVVGWAATEIASRLAPGPVVLVNALHVPVVVSLAEDDESIEVRIEAHSHERRELNGEYQVSVRTAEGRHVEDAELIVDPQAGSSASAPQRASTSRTPS